MISYQPFFEFIKQRGISIYAMEHKFGISKSTLYRIKHGQSITMVVLNDICKALHCRVEDIIVYVEDEE